MPITISELELRADLIDKALEPYVNNNELYYDFVEPTEEELESLLLQGPAESLFELIFGMIPSQFTREMYVVIYRKTAFRKQNKQAAKIYILEENMSMEVTDKIFEDHYAEDIKRKIGV